MPLLGDGSVQVRINREQCKGGGAIRCGGIGHGQETKRKQEKHSPNARWLQNSTVQYGVVDTMLSFIQMEHYTPVFESRILYNAMPGMNQRLRSVRLPTSAENEKCEYQSETTTTDFWWEWNQSPSVAVCSLYRGMP